MEWLLKSVRANGMETHTSRSTVSTFISTLNSEVTISNQEVSNGCRTWRNITSGNATWEWSMKKSTEPECFISYNEKRMYIMFSSWAEQSGTGEIHSLVLSAGQELWPLHPAHVLPHWQHSYILVWILLKPPTGVHPSSPSSNDDIKSLVTSQQFIKEHSSLLFM